MNISLLKKFVAIAASQGSLELSIDTVDILLVFMKKFGKQLSQKNFIDFLQKEYPNVCDLYLVLGGSRCTIKQCLLLRQYLCSAMGDKFIVGISSHDLDGALTQVDKNIVMNVGGDVTNPMLVIDSPTKTYRRSLRDDLIKLI